MKKTYSIPSKTDKITISDNLWGKSSIVITFMVLVSNFSMKGMLLTTLKADQQLSPGEKITSDNGKFTLTLQDDGNLVLTDSSSPVWASGTNGKGAVRLTVQSDGNVVLYTHDNKPVWSTNTQGNPGAVLTLQNDRNLVVYAGDKPLWSSNTFIEGADAHDTAAQASNTPKKAAPALQKYTVVSGDTLYGIAERFLGDGNRYPEIAKLNNIPNPDLINVGVVLTIPHK